MRSSVTEAESTDKLIFMSNLYTVIKQVKKLLTLLAYLTFSIPGLLQPL